MVGVLVALPVIVKLVVGAIVIAPGIAKVIVRVNRKKVNRVQYIVNRS